MPVKPHHWHLYLCPTSFHNSVYFSTLYAQPMENGFKNRPMDYRKHLDPRKKKKKKHREGPFKRSGWYGFPACLRIERVLVSYVLYLAAPLLTPSIAMSPASSYSSWEREGGREGGFEEITFPGNVSWSCLHRKYVQRKEEKREMWNRSSLFSTDTSWGTFSIIFPCSE